MKTYKQLGFAPDADTYGVLLPVNRTLHYKEKADPEADKYWLMNFGDDHRPATFAEIIAAGGKKPWCGEWIVVISSGNIYMVDSISADGFDCKAGTDHILIKWEQLNLIRPAHSSEIETISSPESCVLSPERKAQDPRPKTNSPATDEEICQAEYAAKGAKYEKVASGASVSSAQNSRPKTSSPSEEVSEPCYYPSANCPQQRVCPDTVTSCAVGVSNCEIATHPKAGNKFDCSCKFCGASNARLHSALGYACSACIDVFERPAVIVAGDKPAPAPRRKRWTLPWNVIGG